jgi:hypothetical protein
MERPMKSVREESAANPPDESSVIDDIPNVTVPDVSARRKPTGPKPGKETPGGWRR